MRTGYKRLFYVRGEVATTIASFDARLLSGGWRPERHDSAQGAHGERSAASDVETPGSWTPGMRTARGPHDSHEAGRACPVKRGPPADHLSRFCSLLNVHPHLALCLWENAGFP